MNRRSLTSSVFALGVTLCVAGCSSLDTLGERRNAVPYYGVRRDCLWIRSEWMSPERRLMSLVDLPLSLVLDTALLPYTAPAGFLNAGEGPFWFPPSRLW